MEEENISAETEAVKTKSIYFYIKTSASTRTDVRKESFQQFLFWGEIKLKGFVVVVVVLITPALHYMCA